MLACCLLISSELPLTATVFVIALLLKYHSATAWIVEPMQGRLTFSSAYACEIEGKPLQVKRSLLSLAMFGVLIWFESGRKRILWRDSVAEEQYRQLLVMLKREH